MNILEDMEKFDSIFKNAASDYELSYNQDSWVLMQQKLDAVDKKRRRGGIWWWLFPVVLIAMGTGIYIYFNETERTGIVINTDNQNKIVKKQNADNIQNENLQSVIEENKAVSINSTVKKVNRLIEKNETRAHSANASIDKKSDKTKIEESILVNEGPTNSDNTTHLYSNSNGNRSRLSQKPSQSDLIGLESKKEATNKTDVINNVLNKISSIPYTSVYTPNILYLHNRYIANYKELEAENIIIVAKREEDAKKQLEEESRPRVYSTQFINVPANRWFLTAYLGNNIGYVSNPKISDAHLQFQLGFGYNVTKNISLQTGIAVGYKTFSMRKDQFAYKGPGAYEKYIRNIDADISVIDIPIDLRYQFSDKENSGWFTTIGVSTIFSKKENYIITIDNGPTPNYLYQNFENTPSWLSTLNLSVGYQWPMSKKVIITAEPYIQLPFKVIGEGGSKICSVGLQIGAKYNLPNKKK